MKGNVSWIGIEDVIILIYLSFSLIHLSNHKKNSNPAMEGQGYSKSGFVAESLSPLAILASQVRHDHTYAKAKPKDAVDSSTVSIDSPAGEWDIV